MIVITGGERTLTTTTSGLVFALVLSLLHRFALVLRLAVPGVVLGPVLVATLGAIIIDVVVIVLTTVVLLLVVMVVKGVLPLALRLQLRSYRLDRSRYVRVVARVETIESRHHTDRLFRWSRLAVHFADGQHE